MKDPTKTLTLRGRANREINVRFGKVKKEVRDAVFVGKLITNVVSPGQFEFVRDAGKVAAFNVFLQGVIDREILGIESGEIDPQDFWLNAYVGDAYARGAKKARLRAEREIKSLDKLPDYSPLANPVHAERAELLYTRTFEGMKGLTETMKGQMNRELAQGMLRGDNSKEVAKAMTDRVDKIGITRAKLIARTEIIESHNQASIKESELLENETGVTTKMLWISSLDDRVRHSHELRHGKLYSKGEAERLIGEPNCRCSVSPTFDIEDI